MVQATTFSSGSVGVVGSSARRRRHRHGGSSGMRRATSSLELAGSICPG